MKTLLSLIFVAMLLCFGLQIARAQSFSGFSTVGEFVTNPPPPPKICPNGNPCPVPEIVCAIGKTCPGQYVPIYSPGAYVDTEEDKIAAMYYDVESDSSFFVGGATAPLESARSGARTLSASGTYFVNAPDGLWTELTSHYVDFFYVSGAGYFDPYFVSDGYTDGGYDTDYWYYLQYAPQYVQEVQQLLGQTSDSTNHQVLPPPGPAIVSVLFQQYIAQQNIAGPYGTVPTCASDVYAGDNRGYNPAGGSSRAFQQAVVPIGGYSLPFAPGFQGTQWTFEFSSSVLVNGQIPNSAYNYNSLNKCSSTGIDKYGHATTTGMQYPVAVGGTYESDLTLKGSASNPVPVVAFSIDWSGQVTLTEPVSSAVIVTGNMTIQCFPAAELSVGPLDVLEYTPASSDPVTIASCLAGLGSKTYPIAATLPTYVNTGSTGPQ